MRKLTLDEKIGLKALFLKKGVRMPKLDIQQAIYMFHQLYGGKITEWYKISLTIKK